MSANYYQLSLKRAISLALGLAVGSVAAAPVYLVSDLGTLGGNYGLGQGVNDLGDSTGFASILNNASQQAYISIGGQPATALGTLLGGGGSQALDINNLGQVTGLSYLPNNIGYHAYLWQSGQPVKDLGTLGGSVSRANALSEAGHVTGMAATAGDAQKHAFLWNGLSLQDLGTLGGSSSQGNGINNLDQVTGFSTLATGTAQHAFLWSNGTIQDLGTLGGSHSEGFAVNDSGQVAGSSTTKADAAQHAFLWQKGLFKDLGTLGGSFSEAYAINTAGNVVGYATTTGDSAQHAFVWKTATGIQDLNSLVLPTTGWTLLEAHAISDKGHINGIGSVNGARHAFLLTPDTVPPVISCPAAVTTTGAQPATLGLATAMDNLDPSPTLTNNAPVAPAIFPSGLNVVTWTATDANGNKATCTQNVTINAKDTTPPVVRAQWTPAAPDGLNNWYKTKPSLLAWSVTDPESAITLKNGCIDSSVNVDTGGVSFSCTATSAGGVSPMTTTGIKLDATAPAIVVPAALVKTLSGSPTTAVTYPAAMASDALSGLATSTANPSGVTCTPASGVSLGIGATTVTCSASDNAGNVGSGSFQITVTDPTPPVITANLIGTAGLNGWYISPVTVAWTVVDAESAISGQSPGCASSLVSASGAGQILICSASSAGGVASQSVKVNLDTLPPSVGCPANVSVTQGQAINLGVATATDNLPLTPLITNNAPATFAVGTTPVVWTAADAAGLTSTCTQQVTVNAAAPQTTTDMAITGSSSNGSPALNTTFSFSYQLKNNGKATGQQVGFTDTLPAPFSFVSVSSSTGSCQGPAAGAMGGTVRCALNDIAAGQNATVTITVSATARGAIANTAILSTASIDTTAANNSSTVSVTVK